MPLKLEALQPIIQAVARLKPAGEKVYLVGGAVRDMLLQREIHDLDFVLGGEVRRLARQVADHLGGAFFMLDEERDTARVILNDPPFAGMVLDFARFRADDLLGDLRGRDFTINAMAQDLDHFGQGIDPLGGAEDLLAKRLRLCSPSAIADDPVRAIRSVRVAVNYHLSMQPETIQAVRAASQDLGRVSAERQRDELLFILSGSRIKTAVQLLDQLGVLDPLLPELTALRGAQQGPPHVYDVWEHTLALLQSLESLLGLLAVEPFAGDSNANLFAGLAALRLGRYRPQLSSLFLQPITASRPRRALLYLGALYHDIAKPQMRTVGQDGRIHFYRHDETGEEMISARAQALALSQDEISYLRTLVRQHMRIHFLAKADQKLTRRLIFRYFRDLGEAGVDICLLSLADLQATRGSDLSVETWEAELDICRELLAAWYEQQEEIVAPPRLLNGHDLIARFELEPGPRLGELLEAVREAQAAGEIDTRDQAFEMVRILLEKRS